MTQPSVPTRLRATAPEAAGWWRPEGEHRLAAEPADMRRAVGSLRKPVIAVRTDDGVALADGGVVTLGETTAPRSADAARRAVAAYLPPLPPEQLGDPAFRTTTA